MYYHMFMWEGVLDMSACRTITVTNAPPGVWMIEGGVTFNSEIL